MRSLLTLIALLALCTPAWGQSVRHPPSPTNRPNIPNVGVGSHPDERLYQEATLWDADGDNSVWITCSAKDTPDPACKVAGERIYRDFVDDLNCAVYGCGNGQVSPGGTVYLEEGVYVTWPCWDASNPTVNDPAATDDNLHDEKTDAAYLDCPVDPYSGDDSSARLVSGVLKGRDISIVGAGVDLRANDTTTMAARGTGRTQGTTIAVDLGKTGQAADDEDSADGNVWFDSESVDEVLER